MPALANPNHEKFAQYVAQGMSATQAYGKLKLKGKSKRQLGSLFLSNLDVKARINEIQQKAADGTVLTLRESMEFLARVVRCKVAGIEDTGSDGDLIQELTYTSTESEAGSSVTRKIKIPDKRGAIMDNARLAGWLIEKETGQIDEQGLLKLLSGLGNFINIPKQAGGKVIDVAANVDRLELDAGVGHVDQL